MLCRRERLSEAAGVALQHACDDWPEIVSDVLTDLGNAKKIEPSCVKRLLATLQHDRPYVVYNAARMLTTIMRTGAVSPAARGHVADKLRKSQSKLNPWIYSKGEQKVADRGQFYYIERIGLLNDELSRLADVVSKVKEA